MSFRPPLSGSSLAAGALLVVGVTTWAWAQAAAPHVLPWQGTLRTAAGPADGTFSFTLELSTDDADGGVALWTTTRDVVVRQGFFEVVLGEAPDPDLPDEVFSGADVFLAVRIDGEELAGRQRLLPVPLSVRAEQAGQADLATQAAVATLAEGAAAFVATESVTVERAGAQPTFRLVAPDVGAGQAWFMAQNGLGDFIIDDETADTTPIRIRPGASENALVIDSDGDIGLTAATPAATLHVRRANGTASLLVEEANATAATRTVATMRNNGNVRQRFENSGNGASWQVGTNGANFYIDVPGSGVDEVMITPAGTLQLAGNVEVGGSVVVQGTPLTVPDYVFDDGYPLMPLAEVSDYVARERHLPGVPSARELTAGGIDLVALQLKTLEKVEELTLYTLAQQREIEALKAENADLRRRLPNP